MDELRDLRPLHLHDDLLAGVQRGGVHLRDRRGRERHPVELGEHRFERAAQVFLDHLRARRRRSRRAPGRGKLELAHELFGEQALAGGDDLAELDVGRAEVARRRCAGGGRCRPRDVVLALAPLEERPATDGAAEARASPERPAIPAARVGGRVSSGTSPSTCGAHRSSPASQASSSRSITHGGSSLNAPNARSLGAAAGSVTTRQSRSTLRCREPRRLLCAKRRGGGVRTDDQGERHMVERWIADSELSAKWPDLHAGERR